jgi:DNA-binding CsgD family transcriptional regulator
MLIGRDRERARLSELVSELRAGRGGALVLRGEPGIGKTALLEAALAAAADVRTLAARGIESELEMPFAALHDLLRPVLDRRTDLPDVQRTALEGALALGPPVGGSRFGVYAGVLGLLEATAADGPLLVAVDDAHWLDSASSEALMFAARRLGRAPVAIVLAARTGEGSLETTGLPELVLSGLGRSESSALLDRIDMHQNVRERLIEVSRGNPLALHELPAALTEGQRLGEEPLPEPLPAGSQLERAFRARADRLGQEATRALLIAAASDSPALGLVLRALAKASIRPAALEEAETAGLVEVAGASLEFRHPLMRSAVYRGASGPQRRAAHRAIAEALGEERGEEAEARCAWHLASAALGPDEELAARLDASAAAARARSGYRTAAIGFERAAAITPERSHAARRLLAAAEAGHLAGDSAHAVSLLERALRSTATDDPLREDILALQGRLETWRGPAVAAYGVLLDRASPTADPERAALSLADAVTARIVVGDFPGALEIARRARALGERAGGIAELVTAVQLGKALILVGEAREGHALILRCEELLSENWDDTYAMDLAQAAPALMSVEEYELAERVLRRMVATANELGATGLLPYSLGALSELETRTGRWPSAYAHGAEAVEAARKAGQDGQLSYNLARLARLEAVKGLEEAGREHAARALDLARTYSFDTSALFAEWALGLIELQRGRSDVAVTHLTRAVRLSDGMGCHEPGRGEWAPDLIEALIRDSRETQAAEELDALETDAKRTGRVMALAAVARCRGVMAADDWEDQFLVALALHDRTDVPFERARTELCFGERLRRERRRVDARHHLRSALETFEALGAGPWCARAREELTATGERARSRGPDHIPDLLTAHELRVARVVAEGATNREAAAELFLSPKTIEAHLRSVYRKLGVRSRAELAGLLAGEARRPASNGDPRIPI